MKFLLRLAKIPLFHPSSRRRGKGFQRAGKFPDDAAKDSSVLESFPTTRRRIPACWKVSRQRSEGFQHAGKFPDDAVKDSSMLESLPTTQRRIPACWKVKLFCYSLVLFRHTYILLYFSSSFSYPVFIPISGLKA